MYLFIGVYNGMSVALRVVLGVELREISFLYFLFYMNAAGGFEKLILSNEGSANEFKVKVVV